MSSILKQLKVVSNSSPLINLGIIEHTDDVDGALSYIRKLMDNFLSKSKLYHLKKLTAYIERNRDGTWYKEHINRFWFGRQSRRYTYLSSYEASWNEMVSGKSRLGKKQTMF